MRSEAHPASQASNLDCFFEISSLLRISPTYQNYTFRGLIRNSGHDFSVENPSLHPHPHASPARMSQNTRAIPRQATSYMTTRGGTPPAADDPLLAFAPVPHKQPRRNSITAERQRAFISHLAATGIVTQAAKHIGASMEALYKLRKRPGAEEFDAAQKDNWGCCRGSRCGAAGGLRRFFGLSLRYLRPIGAGD